MICAWMATAVFLAAQAPAAPPSPDAAGLVQQIRTGDPQQQREASNALAKLGATAVEPLVDALRHEDERVRFHAAWALREIGEPAAKALGNVLAGKHTAATYPAAYALATTHDPDLLSRWVTAATDADFRVRYYAVRALARFEDQRADNVIQRALKDEAPLVRQAAAGAAARRGSAGGIDGLAALMHPGIDADTRFRAAFSLWELKDLGTVPALVTGLSDANSRVRHHCAWALGDLKATAAAKPLVEALQRSTDDTLKHYAAVSLKQITGQEFGFDSTKWDEWLRSNAPDQAGGKQ